MAITLNGTTGITTPDITSAGSLNIDASAPDDSLVVNSAGNVGIGTSSPTNFGNGYTVLQVANASNGGMLYLTNTANDGGRIYGNGAGITYDAFGATFQAFNTNGTERMRIDSAGRVTMPYQPAFQAYYTANRVKAAGWTSLPLFDATRFNVGNHFNLSNNRFTAPISGTYAFYFGGFWATGGSDRIAVEMYLNGNTYQAFGAPLSPGDSPWPISTFTVQLNAGDWFSQPAAYSPGNITTGQNQYSIILGGYLVG